MLELREMQLLVALARHRHFARAAEASGISQPAFSMRIRNMEAQLGMAVVKRGNRFQGFTEEGEVVLGWARKLLDDAKTMEQEVRSARGEISGTLTIGVVPTALTFAATIPLKLGGPYPGILTRIMSASSLDILQGLEDGSMDAGVTYSDGVSPDGMDLLPLYEEKYVLVVPEAMAPRQTGTATWDEAADLPLSVLEPQMQNRRILDLTFHEAGREPRVVCETNTFTASLVLVREGFSATIVPERLISAGQPVEGAVVLPLTEPVASRAIGLATIIRRPGQPIIEALKRVMREAWDQSPT